MAAAALRRLLRLPPMLVLVVGGLLTVVLAFPLSGERFRHAAIRRWSRWLCRCCGLALSELAGDGAPALSRLPAGRLIVANHVSWLDIFAINAFCPASFVAKAEIARWPVLGTLVARTGTLFIERGKRHAVHRMIEHIDRALSAGARIAVFPEGTTSDGERLLPFHANLIQAAILGGTPVVPVGIRYMNSDGERPDAVVFVGETTFVASVWRIAGAPRARCEVIPLAEVVPDATTTRHALADRVRGALSSALELPLDDELPDKILALRAAAARDAGAEDDARRRTAAFSR